MSSSQIYAAFEEACMTYSSIINQYQAKSTLTQFLGAPTGSLSGSENTYPARLLEFQKKMAEPYGEEAYLNGSHPVYSGSINLLVGQQKYDLQIELSGTGPLTGSIIPRIVPRKIFHFSPIQAFRFFNSTSAINYLNTQFNFDSFTPETTFYLLPIWEDVARQQQFKESDRVRRSNYSYEVHNNVLTIYPAPTDNRALYIEYSLPPDPTKAANAQEAASRAGVSNLSNIPFGNIQYSKVNSIGKTWIRKMAFAYAKEMEGQIRAKMATIPIPDGDLTLNGPELIADAKGEQDALLAQLRDILDELTYDNLTKKEAEMKDALNKALAGVPMLLFVG